MLFYCLGSASWDECLGSVISMEIISSLKVMFRDYIFSKVLQTRGLFPIMQILYKLCQFSNPFCPYFPHQPDQPARPWLFLPPLLTPECFFSLISKPISSHFLPILYDINLTIHKGYNSFFILCMIFMSLAIKIV